LSSIKICGTILAPDKIEAAVNHVLDQGYRTQDIAGDGNSVVGTSEMGNLVVP
jgi:3-isopropylmalate dehydrogenase